MDYTTLKYVIAVDKYQSISKAAEELYLSQPNISKAIQNIEKEIGFQIFSRTSRGATTTPEGKEFIKKAIKIVRNFDDFSKEFSHIKKQIFSMNIAYPRDLYFQNKFINFSKELTYDSNLNINILEGSTEEIIDMVLKEIVNLGIICVNENDLSYYKKLLVLNYLEYKVFNTLQLQVTINKSNKLSAKAQIERIDLLNQMLITTNTNDYYKYYNEKYNLTAQDNVIKTAIGFHQLSLLSKIPNSYLLSLPMSDDILKLYNCQSTPLNYGIGDWVTIAIYKKTAILTELEKAFAITLNNK